MSRILSTLLVCLLMVSGMAMAMTPAPDKKPTQEDAKAITIKAVDLISAKGLDDAAKSFNENGEFKFGEIYVCVIDFKGAWLVYPPRPAGVGQVVINVKDADGVFIVKEIIKVAQEKGEGWVEYRWLNPASNKIEPKITYAKRIPGKDLVAYVGIYK